MPSYKVTQPRFHEGKLYHPEGKRSVIRRSKPYPNGKVPEGLVLIKETAAQARKASVKAKAETKASEKKKSDDTKEIQSASKDAVQTI